MPKFNPPKEFDFDPANWTEWFARWNRYHAVAKLSEDEEQLQIDSFLYCLGSKSEGIFNGLSLSADDAKSYKKVTEAFQQYFTPRKYIIYERARFFRRDQQPGETVEQYIRALNDIADRCEFSNRSEQMRDRIVVGIVDTDCSREMQKMNVDQLTEGVAINMARQSEEVDKHMKDLAGHGGAAANKSDTVDAVSRVQSSSRPKSRSNHLASSNVSKLSNNTPCGRCGYLTHTRGTCPAKDVSCKSCGKVGHYAKVCRSKSEPNISQVEEEERIFLGEITDTSVGVWTKTISVDKLDAPVQFKLDTGADVSILPSTLCVHVALEKTKKQFVGPGNIKIPVLGSFRAVLTVNNTLRYQHPTVRALSVVA
ncbi:uncharacterized protein [Watersipora subatra]|uniref:uncharacterized protein n=1 Tax=Watersipora subatra TaxID=2589382 RepID=UPI00355B91D8